MDDLATTLRDLRRRIAELEDNAVGIRRGVITDVTGAGEAPTIDLGSADEPIAGAPCLAGYRATRGDNVVALTRGKNPPLILGPTASPRYGEVRTFYSGIISAGSTGLFGPIAHGMGTTPDLIVGSCQGAYNSQINRPAAAQWGWYGIDATNFYVEIIANPVATAVNWFGFGVIL